MKVYEKYRKLFEAGYTNAPISFEISLSKYGFVIRILKWHVGIYVLRVKGNL
jgi:hypothetical protein